jgi:cell division protein FtsB
LNKAANTYWDSPHGSTSTARRPKATRRPRVAAKSRSRTAPPWLSAIIVVSIFVMLCISINYRAFTNMRQEVDQNQRLAAQIQSLTDENIALQEEIHTLKSDPRAIEREAKKIGIDLKSVASGQ